RLGSRAVRKPKCAMVCDRNSLSGRGKQKWMLRAAKIRPRINICPGLKTRCNFLLCKAWRFEHQLASCRMKVSIPHEFEFVPQPKSLVNLPAIAINFADMMIEGSPPKFCGVDCLTAPAIRNGRFRYARQYYLP